MGYDERCHCPMLVDNACSIYEHRPRTCRTYDCRVFAAAGLEPDEESKVEITARVRRWRFAYPTESDRSRHDAARSAAIYLREHPDALPRGLDANIPTQLAVAAVESQPGFTETIQYEVFPPEDGGRSSRAG